MIMHNCWPIKGVNLPTEDGSWGIFVRIGQFKCSRQGFTAVSFPATLYKVQIYRTGNSHYAKSMKYCLGFTTIQIRP